MGYAYQYNMDFEDVLGSMLALNGASILTSFVLQIATYVLTALSLYAIAKRRGISKPWLAWIPVADVWILGSISDQYRYVVKGQNKSKRKALLTLSILVAVIYVAFLVLVIMIIGSAIMGLMQNVGNGQMLERVIGPAFGILGLSLPLAGVAVAYAVIYFMALYDVYTSCDPNNNVLFLVLSILFGITKPFFLFFSRNRDDGMPPRRQTQPTYIPQEPASWQNSPPQEEPWDNQ